VEQCARQREIVLVAHNVGDVRRAVREVGKRQVLGRLIIVRVLQLRPRRRHIVEALENVEVRDPFRECAPLVVHEAFVGRAAAPLVARPVLAVVTRARVRRHRERVEEDAVAARVDDPREPGEALIRPASVDPLVRNRRDRQEGDSALEQRVGPK